ncbi:MAG: hypothetical protein KF819_15730 [Labilithrix sp.]|nr:hypothetical protein [Labilithrix sp.]
MRSLAFLPLAALGLFAVHCGGSPYVGVGPDAAPPDPPADGGDAGPENPDAEGATTASKVDVLLVVDDSASMSDKAEILAGSIGRLARKVAPTGDVHLGVISTSLGGMGGDVCGANDAHDGRAHLRNTEAGGAVVPAAKDGFLRFGGALGTDDVDAFVRDAEAIVRGIGQSGCGLEAQLESAYRFLVQPDPWQSITRDEKNRGAYAGVDEVLLKQRAAFLRPDSLVVVVLLSDEDDSSADPRAVGGQGWAFMTKQFPGSNVFRADGKTTTAPRATSACATNPGSADCDSCALAASKDDPECKKNGGFYGPNEESLNVRFFDMKRRFGVDPQFPLARYTGGFTKVGVPNRDGEHLIVDGVMTPYLGATDCTNPLFASSLPTSANQDLCSLPRGPRGKELVLFAVIGGVPESLVAGTIDWTKILGASPETYDRTGVDPHMIPSVTPRDGVPPPAPRGDNGDPVYPVGRDWDTASEDLQYACTFALPAPRTCTLADPSCDCAGPQAPPLCGAAEGVQLRGKAYPSIRQLRVAKALGDRGLVSSICPRDVTSGYAGTMAALGDRIAPRLVMRK